MMIKSKKFKALLSVNLSFVLTLGLGITTSAQDNQDTPFGDGDQVWVNADGRYYDYSNACYQMDVRTDNVFLLSVDSPTIYFRDPDPLTIYAGYPYGSSGYENTIINLSDQTDNELDKLDCWYALGEVSTSYPSTDLVFRSQLAKISLIVDTTNYTGDDSSLSAIVSEVPFSYSCGPDHPDKIESDHILGQISLKVSRIDENRWKVEGLLIPEKWGVLLINVGTEQKKINLSDIFKEKISAGKVYSANLSLNLEQNLNVDDFKIKDRSTFTAVFTAGSSDLVRYDVLPESIDDIPIEMDQSSSSGTSIETALKGKVTVPYEMEQLSLSDFIFSTTFPDHGPIRFYSDNEASFNDNQLWGYIRLSSENVWGTSPIQLNEGTTQTVLILLEYVGENRHFSIDITRSPKPSPAISVSAEQLDFEVLKEGYQSVTSQLITIENSGNASVTLEQPSSTSAFEVSTLAKTQLNPGESTELVVSPRVGLKPGKYDETITIKTTDGIEVNVTLSVVVEPGSKEDSGAINHSSCAAYDQNCDGVITCQERHGQGWTWSESDKACVLTSSIGLNNMQANSGYLLVNTSDQ